MKEERIEELKRIKASLVEFVKGERFGEWDTNGRKIREALACLNIAIKDSESRAEKRYIGVFFNRKNHEEEIEVPFYSSRKIGSIYNKDSANYAKWEYCEKNNLVASDYLLGEVFREKVSN